MSEWVRQKMVPVYVKGERDVCAHSAPAAFGTLRKIWLGGLVNPCALFTALRQEKAVICNKYIDEVIVSFCVFLVANPFLGHHCV
jgi:hypothetical protein